MGNSFGKAFQVTTFGESHGEGLGVVVSGCPAGIPLEETCIQKELDRRKPGQSNITTQRKEADKAQIISGVFEGKTLGTALTVLLWNKDARSKDYDHLAKAFRPSHADYTYQKKYGHRDHRGGGRASARETAARVAGGAVAQKFLQKYFGTKTLAWVEQVHHLQAKVNPEEVSSKEVEANPVRCPDREMAEKMYHHIQQIRREGDSVGGVVRAVVRGCPAGLGEPVFDKLTADLAKGLMSLPATRGVEFGLGFDATQLKGSEHNDAFVQKAGKIGTKTNHSGGVQGGISNGENIDLRVAFKPTATVLQKQMGLDEKGNPTEIQGRGRHDPCVLPRAVPIVEAMINLVLADHLLRGLGARDPESFATAYTKRKESFP